MAGFSGVIRIDDHVAAYGLANRAAGVPNTPETRFGLASGAKAFTALVVVSLIEDGLLELEMPARSLLGADLPLIDDAVTIEHLLSHRSGIGDYLDESAGGSVNDYVLPVPVHTLVDTEDFLTVLDGFPQVSPPGEQFAYNNSGFVVLALLAERAAAIPFADLVAERVCKPAGMADTEFLRSDELPPGVAVGYLEADGLRTNVLHLPVRGTGDGGIYSTVADVHALWDAFLGGHIVEPRWVDEMLRPRSDEYGLGFWLRPDDDVVYFEGCDAGVSFRSTLVRGTGRRHTVLSNTSMGAWPVVRYLASSSSSQTLPSGSVTSA